MSKELENEIRDFFETHYEGTEGYIAIVTKNDDGDLSSERWFPWPEQKTRMVKYCAIRADEDVYVSTCVFSSERRTNEDTQAVTKVIWADADTCAPDKFLIPPTSSVQTSKSKWHTWWVLDEVVSAAAASGLARRISKKHESQGCDNGWHVSKILRVPGTMNTKREDPEPVVWHRTGDVYTFDTIYALYEDVELDTFDGDNLPDKAPTPITGDRLVQLESKLPADLVPLYREMPQEGQSWSQRLFRLELDLFRLGLDAVEVFSLAREAACNKYNPEAVGQYTQTGVRIPKRRNPDGVLWQEIRKAHADYEASLHVEVEESLNLVPVTSRVDRPVFLDDQEREYIAERGNFIEDYTTWVTDNTRSAEVYQRSMAWMLLSCVYGGRGKLDLKFDKDTELNFWTFILGDSTLSHKTTAYNFMLSTLHKYEAKSGMDIDIGSDATPEALIVLLGKRDGKVSLMHMEEVTGWFDQMMGQQYRANSLETFTKLYDGRVPKVIRASKENSNSNNARTVFNFTGVGIRKRFAEILTRSHFESGFLMRMTWAVDDPPVRKKGDFAIHFDQNKSAGELAPQPFDDRQNKLVKALFDGAKNWSPANPVKLWMAMATENRYNRWIEDALDGVDKRDQDFLQAAVLRLAGTVRRCAALLALHEGSSVITMAQLLPALEQSELWWRDMVRMASEVSSSEFERRQIEVQQYILSGADHRRLESAVRRKFSRFRPREMEEVLTALQKSGWIRPVKGTQQLEALS